MFLGKDAFNLKMKIFFIHLYTIRYKLVFGCCLNMRKTLFFLFYSKLKLKDVPRSKSLLCGHIEM